MKLANVLSASALLAILGLVACSTPTAAKTDDKDNTSDEGDDDKDEKETKDGKTSPTNTPTGGDTGTTAGDDDDDDDDGAMSAAQQACFACVSKDAQYKAALECEKAAGDDETKADKCFAACDTEDGGFCETARKACASECAAADAEDQKEDAAEEANDKKCAECAAKSTNSQVKAIEACFSAAGDDDTKGEKCDAMFDSKCDATCQSVYEKCGC
jgi:hypothetical protein